MSYRTKEHFQQQSTTSYPQLPAAFLSFSALLPSPHACVRDGSSQFVNYEESLLIKLLSEALGGNSMALILGTLKQVKKRKKERLRPSGTWVWGWEAVLSAASGHCSTAHRSSRWDCLHGVT